MINLLPGAEDVEDEVLIKAIRRMNDPEADPKRIESDSDNDSADEGAFLKLASKPIDKDMERMQQDTALRHHLKIGSAFTGPKGVLADYKFHKQQERARKEESDLKNAKKLSNAALSSGWLQRTLIEEEKEDDDQDFLEAYRKKRMQELARMSAAKFGQVIELNVDNYVRAIDGEAPDVKVLIHLCDTSNFASRQVDEFFDLLSKKYKGTKFCRIEALDADPDFDLIGLPAVLVYKGGSLDISLIRMIDEIPDWASSKRCSLRDFEEYLILQEVLDDQPCFQDQHDSDSDSD